MHNNFAKGKKTCPAPYFHPFFLVFQVLSSLLLREVIKIYFSSLFKGVGVEGEGSNYASAQSPCQNENFVNTSKKVL